MKDANLIMRSRDYLIVRDMIFNKFIFNLEQTLWTQLGHKYRSYDKFTRDCQRVGH